MAGGLLLVARLGLVAVVCAGGCGHAERGVPAEPPPAASSQQPEVESVLEGDLEVIVEDSEPTSRVLYFLHVDDRRIPLRFSGDPPDLLTGARVRVSGRWDADGTFVVTSVEAAPPPPPR